MLDANIRILLDFWRPRLFAEFQAPVGRRSKGTF